MKTTNRNNLTIIREAIESLNSNYGRGDICAIGLLLDGNGWFAYTIPTSHYGRSPEVKRKFSIRSQGESITVFALGHQKTVINHKGMTE